MLGGLLSTKRKDQGTIESRTTEAAGETYDYQIYVPPDAREEPAPVIVFLHGIGQRGSNGLIPTSGAGGALAKHYFAHAPAIVLLPQCREGKYWSDPKMTEMVMNALRQTVEEFAADERRISLVGVSMGGYGVWHLAEKFPGKFAALVSICGGSSITRGERFAPVAEKVAKTPAWVFHGAADKVVPVSESRQMVKAIELCGGNVKYNEYENVGHNVWLNVIGEPDLLDWILAQRVE